MKPRKKAKIDSTLAFEQALAAAERLGEHYFLRLFVTGATPKSARAIQNIRAICEDNLKGRFELEVIDIHQHPEHIQQEQLIATPTLVKRLPLPFRKLVGDMSDKVRVLAGLDIAAQILDSAKLPEGGHGV